MISPETLGIVWTFIIGMIVLFVCFFLFAWLKAKVPGIYQFRMLASQLSMYNDYNDDPVYAPEQPQGIFSWPSVTWLYTEDKLFRTHGLDAVMFTRFMKSSLWICCILCFIAAILLFPVYATGGRHHLSSKDPLYTSGLELVSMSNLERDDPRLWASMLFEYIVVFTVLVFLFLDYRAYYQYRIQYKAQERPTNYALLLVDIPQSDDMHELVQERFRRLFPNDTPYIAPILNLKCVRKLWKKLEKLQDCKERLEYKCSQNNPTHNGQEKRSKRTCGIPSKSKLEKLQECNAMLRDTKVQLAVERDKLRRESNSNTTAFLVICQYKCQAAFARQTCLFEETMQWVVSSAADPQGIHWDAISWSPRLSLLRKSFAVAVIFLLIIFWTVPVTFVSSLANIRSLSHVKFLHWLSFITKLSPEVVAFLDGILPAVILVILFSLVPWILGQILLQTRNFSLPHIDCQVQIWYMVFLVVEVFLVYVIGGSAFGNLQAMIDGLVGFSISLLLFGRLILRWFKLHWTAKTEREKERVIAHAVSAFPYSSHYGAGFIVIFLCLMYSVMSPFLLFFGSIYFAWGICVTKYQLLYVNVPKYEAGGIHFPHLFYASIVTLLLQQLVMIALFGLNQFGPGFIIVPLPFLTLFYARWLLRRFGSVSKHGAVYSMIDKECRVPIHYLDLYKYPLTCNALDTTEDETENAKIV
ncbi:hypothetical protein GAYE_SCF42G5549 [Galdieria yellowstonensis]|uniref:Uncharacterized protein n=1 Tax=Galdieria yellowstonensis TaxID=3028027 RepID=A0AAV9IJK7_9RHOD|nr:hypothetical protein GAYE_SCF42G5549 [Galdieria yellowstonensis]